jgi:hypothetical protein
MDNLKQYPEWQQSMRAAQVIVERRCAEEAAARKAEAEERHRLFVATTAQHLKEILAKVGIDADPQMNFYRIDQFIFRQTNYTPFKYRNDTREMVEVELCIAHVDLVEDADDPQDLEWVEVYAKGAKDADWPDFKARVAQALDRLNADAADYVAEQKRREEKARLEAEMLAKAAAIAPPTWNERFATRLYRLAGWLEKHSAAAIYRLADWVEAL